MFAQQASKKFHSYGGGRIRWPLRDATVRNWLCSVADASVRVTFQHFSKPSALRVCWTPSGLQTDAKHEGKLNGVRKLRWRANSLAPRTRLWLGSVLTLSDGCHMRFSWVVVDTFQKVSTLGVTLEI